MASLFGRTRWIALAALGTRVVLQYRWNDDGTLASVLPQPSP